MTDKNDMHQTISDIIRKHGLAANTALVEELGSVVKLAEVDQNEPYVNHMDTNDLLDASLMYYIIDDIYQHSFRRGWERCVIRVEQEMKPNESIFKGNQD